MTVDAQCSQHVTIGVIQSQSSDDLEYNFQAFERQVKELVSMGAKMVFSPENVLLFADRDSYQRHAETLHRGPIQNRIAHLARRVNAWLHIGSFPLVAPSGKLKTATLLFSNEGQLVAHYSKLHLFDVEVQDGHGQYRESDTYHAGSEAVVVHTPAGPLGLSICYDLRFPSLYHTLTAKGAKVLVVPAAFTTVTGQAHWETLLRARAIENQCWVVASAQCGQHSDSRTTWGRSMVVDPWGRIVKSLSDTAGQFVVSIDHQQTEEVRTAMPVQAHSRFQSQFKE